MKWWGGEVVGWWSDVSGVPLGLVCQARSAQNSVSVLLKSRAAVSGT